MQRFFRGTLCFADLCLLSGCAVFHDVSNRFAQKSRAILHPETVAPTQECLTAQICLHDPAASIQETSPVPAIDEASIVEFPETTHDFGTMREDKEYVHKFIMKNVRRFQSKIEKSYPAEKFRLPSSTGGSTPVVRGPSHLSLIRELASAAQKKPPLLTCDAPDAQFHPGPPGPGKHLRLVTGYNLYGQ